MSFFLEDEAAGWEWGEGWDEAGEGERLGAHLKGRRGVRLKRPLRELRKAVRSETKEAIL